MQMHVRLRLYSADVVLKYQAGIDWVQWQHFATHEAVPSYSTAYIAASAAGAAAVAAGYSNLSTPSVCFFCMVSLT